MTLGKFFKHYDTNKTVRYRMRWSFCDIPIKGRNSDMILDAELKKNRKDASTGQLIFEVKDEDGM